MSNPKVPTAYGAEKPYDFDMSISTLMRINYSLYNINNMCFSGDRDSLGAKFQLLKVIDREVDPMIKEEERAKLSLIRKKLSGLAHIPRNINLSNSMFDDFLDDYERQIRRLLQKYNLYMKEADDKGSAIIR